MPVYKDYTVVADYERLKIGYIEDIGTPAILSKSYTVGQGAFLMNLIGSTGEHMNAYTFGNANSAIFNDLSKKIYYQSKYKMQGFDMTIGSGVDGDSLWLGVVRDNDSRFFNGAIYSLMTFPYSMSEFLIERQLKKHKLGTLYPDMVEWRPIYTSNVNDYTVTRTAYFGEAGQFDLALGSHYSIGTRIRIYVKPNGAADEVTSIKVNGVELTYDYVDSNYGYAFNGTLSDKFPQKINITIDEYIRYEDIVQPYPLFFEFTDENNNLISWGSKAKVGSTITRTKGVSYANLLEGLYTITNPRLNGVPLSSSQHVVEKSMVFTCTATWAFDNNEPKCILSPRLLRIPNSGYKILGYIPDISGHGNHGNIKNSVYAEMSGANGYPIILGVGKSYQDMGSYAKIIGDNQNIISITNIVFTTALLFSYIKYNGVLATNFNKDYPSYKIKVTGIQESFNLQYTYLESSNATATSKFYIENDGTYTIPKSYKSDGSITNDSVWIGFSFNGSASEQVNLTIEVLPEYEGAFCLDGVNDFVSIPTVIGGKQVFIKVNVMSTVDKILYDQRNSEEGGNFSDLFAIMTSNSDSILAYAGRNPDGKTYIDGILNTNITCGQLLNITHNITALVGDNKPLGKGGVIIGASKTPASYCKAAVYDFMLFDEISTDDKIKELNEYVGVEAKVELPPYYWDAYGKTNFDEDRATIQQKGVAKGYNFASFDDELDWYLTPNNNHIDVVSRNGYEITLKNLSAEMQSWYFQNSTAKGFITKDIPFKVKANKSIRVYWDMHSYKISSGESFGHVVSITTLNPNEDTSINLRHLTEEELTELDTDKSRMYYLLWFDLSTLAIDEEVTIEMLPVERGKSLALTNNNLAYDKMSGYEGYEFDKFTNRTMWNINASSIETVNVNDYSITLKKLIIDETKQLYGKIVGVLNKEVILKCKSNKHLFLGWQLKYKTEEGGSDNTLQIPLDSSDIPANTEMEFILPYKTKEELATLGAIESSVWYLVYFSNRYLEIGEEYTVEMLPLYPNGLVYDGVEDNSNNANIPVLTDYTYIFKRELLGLDKNSGTASMYKGSFVPAGGRAFIADYYINAGGETDGTYGFSYGSSVKSPTLLTDKIVYGTKTSVNGVSVTPGSAVDDASLTLGKWNVNYKQMVFYKLILYPKTISLLEINFLKNLMEKDEIIDLTNPIFIQ